MSIEMREKPSARDRTGRSCSTADCHVLVTGDIFRLLAAPEGRWYWHQEDNVRWLGHLVRGALASNQDIRVGILDHAALGLSPANFGPRQDQSIEAWWIEAMDDSLPPDIDARIRKAVAGKIVVAFEPPAALRHAIEDTALALLDIEVAPIRFLNGILLSARSSHPGLQAAIESVAMDERELWWRFGTMRARMGHLSLEGIEAIQGASLIAAQTPADRALVDAGKMLNLADFTAELRALATDESLLILTPHPHSAGYVAGIEALASIGAIKISGANSYRLLATGKIDRVVAISSSLLEEAKFFGVGSVKLAPPRAAHGTTIDVLAIGGALADQIAAIGGFALPPLTRGLREEPTFAQAGANSWAYAGIQDARPVFTGLTVGQLPCTASVEDGRLATALTFGWHHIEPWGVWSGRVGIIGIIWPENVGSLSCTLELRSPGIDVKPQGFAIWCEGEEVMRDSLIAGADASFRFDVSRPARAGPLQIWLVCDRSFKPSDHLPDYHDHRDIGLGLSGLALEPAGQPC